MNQFEIIHVSDTHFGKEIGYRYKPSIQQQMAGIQKRHPDNYLVTHDIQPYLLSSIAHVDYLVGQLSAMAEASGVPFCRLFRTFIPELDESDRWLDRPDTAMRCTTLVSFNTKGEATIGHNEDWKVGEPSKSIAYLETPTTIGLWYKGEGLGSAINVNAYGLWQCTNQVNILPLPTGVPRLLTAWHLTGYHRVDEAIRFIQNTPQASAFTYVFVQHGKVTRVEHAYGATEYKVSPDTTVSTNHLLYPSTATYQREVPVQSKIRLDIARKQVNVDMTPEEIIAVLSDPKVSRPETLASVVATDVGVQRQMRICYGRPGEDSVYVPYPMPFINEQF